MMLRYSKGNGVRTFAVRLINQSPSDAATGVAVEAGVIITFSIASRRPFWTFA
jgi:hypothetical protein